MKDENKKLTNVSKITEKEIKIKRIEEENALRLKLTAGPDELIKTKYTDAALDSYLEKIELINGRIINVKEILAYIDGKIRDYGIKFRQEFYKEIFRLKGWVIPDSGVIKEKPQIVAVYTALYIYGRFPKEILTELQDSNKFNDEMGQRMYKHFNLLTPDGVIKLEKFINDSIDIMKKCQNWDEFVREHAKAYGKPFQTSLFSDK